MAPAQGQGNATRLARAASNYELPIIITSVNYSTLSEVLALLPEHEEMHICIDMLNTPDGIELITDEFGPERLLFGSNYPTTYLPGPLLAVQKAEINSAAKRGILRGNAARLLGIK
jgi:predicted TIM-barrel fold metal-dependent hydrolase